MIDRQINSWWTDKWTDWINAILFCFLLSTTTWINRYHHNDWETLCSPSVDISTLYVLASSHPNRSQPETSSGFHSSPSSSLYPSISVLFSPARCSCDIHNGSLFLLIHTYNHQIKHCSEIIKSLVPIPLKQ